MTPASHDPIKRATVSLNGKAYDLKFRLSDLSELNKTYGIDLFIPAEVQGFAAVDRMAKIIAAGIAHTGEGITAEQVMENIELPEIPIYALAIAEATKKASPESVKASEALAKMTPKKPAKSEPKPEPSIQ